MLNSPQSPKSLSKPPSRICRRKNSAFAEAQIQGFLQAAGFTAMLQVPHKTKHHSALIAIEPLCHFTSAFLGRQTAANLTVALVLFCFAFEINKLQRNIKVTSMY